MRPNWGNLAVVVLMGSLLFEDIVVVAHGVGVSVGVDGGLYLGQGVGLKFYFRRQ